MTTQPGQGRLTNKEESEIKADPIHEPSNIHSIVTFRELFSSSFGPFGSLKNIHNNKGGNITVTSISSRILQNVSFSKPILRLVVTSIESHIKIFGDQGIFAGLLCTLLIEGYLKTGFNQHQIVEALELLLDETMKYFSMSQCACKMKLNFQNIDNMLKLVESIISSKPLCGFSAPQVSFTSKLIVELFLMLYTGEDGISKNRRKDSLQYVFMEGYSIEETHIIDGILYEVPHIPVYRKSPLKFKTIELEADGSDTPSTKKECVKVMLVDISLAGDSQDFVGATYELETYISLSDSVVINLMELAQYAVDNSVGLFACQKVIHPQAKKFLRENNVLVLERLGSQFIGMFTNLTGAECHGSLNLPTNDKHFGFVKSIRHCVYKRKSFVQIEGLKSMSDRMTNVYTMILGNKNEEALQEMKTLFQSAMTALELSVKDPWALHGGGCWQTQLVSFIKNKLCVKCSSWAEELSVSETVMKEMCEVFTTSLLRCVIALDSEVEHWADSQYNHHWMLPHGCDNPGDNSHLCCSCGKLQFNKSTMKLNLIGRGNYCDNSGGQESSGEVTTECDDNPVKIIDCFSSSIHALQTAVTTASMVLGIHNIIQQK